LDELRQGGEMRGGAPARRAAARQPAADPTQAHRDVEVPDEPAHRRSVPGPQEVAEATGAMWSSEAVAGGGPRPAAKRRIRGQLDPSVELARARQELDGKPDRAFLRLALVLRHDPTLAPMVLDALRLRREPAAALVRGDAQRLLGRHLEAEAAFDAAADSLEAS